MKKLIIAAVAICAAAAANAAAANWKATAANVYDGTGNATTTAGKLASATALIFDAGVMSQSDLYAKIKNGDTISASTAGYAAQATISSGAMTATTFSYAEQATGDHSFYFAIIDSSNVYFSNIKTAAAGGTAAAVSLAFGSQIASPIDSKTAPTTIGYVGAGKWSAVPEPTSAMLLLLGVAGLALRRKAK